DRRAMNRISDRGEYKFPVPRNTCLSDDECNVGSVSLFELAAKPIDQDLQNVSVEPIDPHFRCACLDSVQQGPKCVKTLVLRAAQECLSIPRVVLCDRDLQQ